MTPTTGQNGKNPCVNGVNDANKTSRRTAKAFGSVALVAFTLTAFTIWEGCKKSSPPPADPGAQTTTGLNGEAKTASQGAPLKGISLDGLSEKKKERFESFADKLPSPCGKAHSLRTSVNEDAECKRAKYAAEYVVSMLGDEASDADVTNMYKGRYQKEKHPDEPSFDLSKSPYQGQTDAQVTMIEYFDYGCGACAIFKPVIEDVMKTLPAGDAVLYYKMFPLDAHPNSVYAAQGAIAAYQQGKDWDTRMKNFKAMHNVLFKNPGRHTKTDVFTHAKALGLDMKAFEKDYLAAKKQVDSDRKEGITQAHVNGTPTIVINGTTYEGPRSAKYLKAYIAEVIATRQ